MVFKEWGWPIESRDGRAGGYRLEYVLPKDIHFTPSELMAFAIFSCQGSSVLPATEAEKLKGKLKALFSAPTRRGVDALEGAITVKALAANDWELMEHVYACLSDPHCMLVLDYQKPTETEPTRREVYPVKMRVENQVFYLDLVQPPESKVKSFRFDRIKRACRVRQDQPFHPVEKTCTEDHKWDFGSGDVVPVELEVTPGLARWLRENPEHPSQELRTESERCFVSYQVKRVNLFADWVLSLRGARVVGPEELRVAIADRARAWLGVDGTLGVPWETG